MLDEALAETGMLVTLYDSPRTWPLLRRVLAMAMAGDGRGLLELSDLYYQRDPKTGRYSKRIRGQRRDQCLDHPDRGQSVTDVQAELPDYQQASPLIGASFAWGDLTCTYWPVPPKVSRIRCTMRAHHRSS
jgi:hypothetical protein